MRKVRYVMAALAAGTVLVAGGASAAATTGHRMAAKATVKEWKSSKYGEILENAAGRTLYGLTADKKNKSVCTGGCTGVWPPLVDKHAPVAGSGVKKAWLKTFVRSGTTRQVEYHGHPLYTYSGDSAHGQVNGFGIAADGGKWYPVRAKTGKFVTKSSGGGGGGW